MVLIDKKQNNSTIPWSHFFKLISSCKTIIFLTFSVMNRHGNWRSCRNCISFPPQWGYSLCLGVEIQTLLSIEMQTSLETSWKIKNSLLVLWSLNHINKTENHIFPFFQFFFSHHLFPLSTTSFAFLFLIFILTLSCSSLFSPFYTNTFSFLLSLSQTLFLSSSLPSHYDLMFFLISICYHFHCPLHHFFSSLTHTLSLTHYLVFQLSFPLPSLSLSLFPFSTTLPSFLFLYLFIVSFISHAYTFFLSLSLISTLLLSTLSLSLFLSSSFPFLY